MGEHEELQMSIDSDWVTDPEAQFVKKSSGAKAKASVVIIGMCMLIGLVVTLAARQRTGALKMSVNEVIAEDDLTDQVQKFLPPGVTYQNGTFSMDNFSINLGSCAVNSIMAVTAATGIGFNTEAALKNCDRSTDFFVEERCAADISAVVGSFTAMGAFISDAIYECTDKDKHTGAKCAADALAVTAHLSNIALHLAKLSYHCPHAERLKGNEIQDSLLIGSKILLKGRSYKVDGNSSMYSCVMNSVMAANAFVSVWTKVSSSMSSCSSAKDHGLGKNVCAQHALSVVGALSYGSAELASAIDMCSENRNIDAQCASDIANVLASIASMTGRSTRMEKDCSPEMLKE